MLASRVVLSNPFLVNNKSTDKNHPLSVVYYRVNDSSVVVRPQVIHLLGSESVLCYQMIMRFNMHIIPPTEELTFVNFVTCSTTSVTPLFHDDVDDTLSYTYK